MLHFVTLTAFYLHSKSIMLSYCKLLSNTFLQGQYWTVENRSTITRGQIRMSLLGSLEKSCSTCTFSCTYVATANTLLVSGFCLWLEQHLILRHLLMLFLKRYLVLWV